MQETLAGSEVPVRVPLTGSVVIVQKSQEILLRDLFRSFMTAFGVIAIVMMLMLRSVIGGLIAMAPNSVSHDRAVRIDGIVADSA